MTINECVDWTDTPSTFASANRTYSYGAHAAHVAVDPRTGDVEVLDYVAVEDVGRIINPRTLEGQAVGAIVQGLGGVIANAVSAALAPLGVSVTDLPLPPSRIWTLVQSCHPRSR